MRRNTLAEIDLRLVAVDSVVAHARLIEQANARIMALSTQQFQMRIDLLVLAANLQSVATTIAQRIESAEQRLDRISSKLL